jgi:hypothetical protein
MIAARGLCGARHCLPLTAAGDDRMSEGRQDALTELVRILREQLARKDERIAALESLLQEANRRIAEQHRMLSRMLERDTVQTPPPPAATPRIPRSPVSDAASGSPPPAPPRETPTAAPQPLPPAPRAAKDRRAPLPDMEPQIEVIAHAVIAAAAARREETENENAEREITARFERGELRKGHSALEPGKRGLWRWFSRSKTGARNGN